MFHLLAKRSQETFANIKREYNSLVWKIKILAGLGSRDFRHAYRHTSWGSPLLA